MSNIKLTYFDIHGGRAESVRMAFSIGNIEFEDHRISFPDFGALRDNLPLKAVPVMEMDGVVYTQSGAMTRYAGKLAGLYPEDAWQAFLCDEILEISEDITVAVVKTFGLEGDALKTARQELAEGKFTDALRLFDQRLKTAGGEYFADGRLTVADLKSFLWIRALRSGMLDHIPSDLTDQVAPRLNDHMERVAALPALANYIAATT